MANLQSSLLFSANVPFGIDRFPRAAAIAAVSSSTNVGRSQLHSSAKDMALWGGYWVEVDNVNSLSHKYLASPL